jgi:tyrosine decarboxylase
VAPLCKPDFNLVVFAFNERGNESLEHMNHLNQEMYELCSYKSGPVYRKNFITSKTILGYEEYGDAPWALACRLGIPEDEWQRVRSLFVLRSAVVTPFLAGHVNFEQYWQGFLDAIRLKLARAAQDIAA